MKNPWKSELFDSEKNEWTIWTADDFESCLEDIIRFRQQGFPDRYTQARLVTPERQS